MTLVLALVLAAIATAALCVAMRRHQGLLFPGGLSATRKRSLQSAGYAGLVLAAFLFARALGALVGLTFFTGWFTVCMLGTALTAAWLQQRHGEGTPWRAPQSSRRC